MDVLWSEAGPCLVRDVVAQLRPQRVLAYTTVMTVMDTLHRKGFLSRERDGRAWRYVARISRQAYTAALMSEALSATGDRAGALAHFVDQIDAEDTDALAQALAAALARRRERPT